MRGQCSVCLEELFSSTTTSQPAKCGHYIHGKCLKELLKANIYKCPTCCKALVDLSEYYSSLEEEIASVQMPEEYRDLEVEILCNDCNLKCMAKFHIFGMKCTHCNSFNTKRA